MKLLLDTHIWLWSVLEPGRLGKRVTRELTSGDNELWLSPISVWEATLLAERGRIAVRDDRTEWIERLLRAAPVREAALTFDVAVQSRTIKLPHPDPADRFLAASAKVHGLTLVTADERLLRAKVCQTLANG